MGYSVSFPEHKISLNTGNDIKIQMNWRKQIREKMFRDD